MDSIISLAFPLILMLGLFYIVVFVPENRRRKKYETMLNAVKVNDEILSKGGIMGKVTSIQDDFVVVQTGPDRVKIKLSKNGIAAVTKEAAAAAEEK